MTDSLPSARRRELLEESRVFCMAPWTHLHVLPRGQIFPCCFSAHLHDLALGDLNEDDTLQEAWNSDRMKALRRGMLSGQASEMCERCYEQDGLGQESFRAAINRDFADHFSVVSRTGDDGTLERFHVPYLDIRFSNLCNYKCRICDPELSSHWYEDSKALGRRSASDPKLIRAGRDPEFLWQQLEPLLPHVQKIQFAGGEPLLMDEHYRILETFIELGKLDVHITYNTNLSVLDYKGHDVPALWRQFDRIFVMASLDGMGARGDYMRKGQRWDDVVANRQRMLRECPEVEFRVFPTVSVMNVLHMPDFYRELREGGLIGTDGMFLNILFEPEYYNIRGLPPSLKRQVEEQYRAFIEGYLGEIDEPGVEWVRSHFEAVLAYMHGGQLDAGTAFKQITRQLDSLRDESFADTFPELRRLV